MHYPKKKVWSALRCITRTRKFGQRCAALPEEERFVRTALHYTRIKFGQRCAALPEEGSLDSAALHDPHVNRILSIDIGNPFFSFLFVNLQPCQQRVSHRYIKIPLIQERDAWLAFESAVFASFPHHLVEATQAPFAYSHDVATWNRRVRIKEQPLRNGLA